MLENNNETATATALLNANSELIAQVATLTESKEILKAEIAQLQDSNDRINKERTLDYANAQAYLAKLNEERSKYGKIRDHIQASIDNEEWTEDELAEPFWEELADMLNLDLKQTEEIEVTFTATYSAWVTVPKNTDITDLEIDLAWHPDVTLNGDGVGSANQDNVEVDPA